MLLKNLKKEAQDPSFREAAGLKEQIIDIPLTGINGEALHWYNLSEYIIKEVQRDKKRKNNKEGVINQLEGQAKEPILPYLLKSAQWRKAADKAIKEAGRKGLTLSEEEVKDIAGQENIDLTKQYENTGKFTRELATFSTYGLYRFFHNIVAVITFGLVIPWLPKNWLSVREYLDKYLKYKKKAEGIFAGIFEYRPMHREKRGEFLSIKNHQYEKDPMKAESQLLVRNEAIDKIFEEGGWGYRYGKEYSRNIGNRKRI